MRVSRWSLLGSTALVVGCASAAMSGGGSGATPGGDGGGGGGGGVNVRIPLGARLTSGALTGAPIPLRRDPNAKVILSSAGNLPAASYLPSQAVRGAKVYNETCATCHQPDQFIGRNFVESWNDRRVYDFYALVRGTMPLDNPGGLKEQEYLDVMSYLLQANHAAPGPDALQADTTAMRAHRIAVRAP